MHVPYIHPSSLARPCRDQSWRVYGHLDHQVIPDSAINMRQSRLTSVPSSLQALHHQLLLLLRLLPAQLLPLLQPQEVNFWHGHRRSSLHVHCLCINISHQSAGSRLEGCRILEQHSAGIAGGLCIDTCQACLLAAWFLCGSRCKASPLACL